ncbi:PucR family transcriptional regulator [Streptomyces gobiensis]|uniref:PucR family transcriptional regulator n=1 Tax=Streptomyces gobiensis TaxID=2875706 RepID=UPI001E3D38B2|nr:helix-turn-helix domain-containing protein [Streptomyces gobiensis]UGY94443.1 helix-turn-helix domain-containing protein [Streptomyces gobiensis]
MTEAIREEVPKSSGTVRTGVERAVRTVLSRVTTSDAVGRDRRTPQQRLLEALTAEAPVPHSTVTELARSAGWALPNTVRAVAVLPRPGAPLHALDDSAVLADSAGQGTYLLLPDPDDPGAGTRELLGRLLRGRTAAVGPAVPLADAGSSLRWARGLLDLIPDLHDPGTRLVYVDEHLSTLLLLQDASLAGLFAKRWLQPLADLTPRQSERVVETLLAWLECGGAHEAAKILKVHPQTVRYRMRQIEKLYGSALRDPHSRFELQLALRSERLAAEVRHGRSRAKRRMMRGAAGGSAVEIDREARVNGL